MNKNMLFSIVLISCSTLFLLLFFSGGLFVLDYFARENTVQANNLPFYAKGHKGKEKIRLKDTEVALSFNRNKIQETITIAFTGDLIMEGSIERAMKLHGIDYPFLQVKQEIQEADYAIVNLETAVTTRGKADDKQYKFRTGPHSLQALKQAGFDMVSLANNHTMDYGEEGLLDTIDYVKKAGLDFVGAGRNSQEAYAAHTVQIKGKELAILGFSRVLPNVNWYAGNSKPGIASGYQIDRMKKIIEDVKKEADYVFVYMHWGVERKQTPEPYQQKDAKAMIDAGADGIIGAHPHVIQELEYYKGKPIAYSIGNFFFPDYVNGLTAESCVLTFVIEGDDISMKYTPYVITNNQVAAVSRDVEKARLLALEKKSLHTILDGNFFISEK